MDKIHDVYCACRDCVSTGRGPFVALQEVIDRVNGMGDGQLTHIHNVFGDSSVSSVDVGVATDSKED